MKTYLIIIIFLIFILGSVQLYSDDLVKRTVLILPFYNVNDNKEYEYLSGILRDALRSQLVNTGQYLYTDFSLIDKKIETLGLKIFINEEKAQKLAMELKSDVIVIGKYTIIEDHILITISAIDIFKNQIVAGSTVTGELGIDVFRVVDESSKDIAQKMNQNIKMVDKSYFDEMMRLKMSENDHPVYWKRHFLNISLLGCYTRIYQLNNTYTNEYSGIQGNGGAFGGSFGYLYGFTPYFAFGSGFSGFLILFHSSNMGDNNDIGSNGSTLLLMQFMFGDLKHKRIAFLFDIGGLLLFGFKTGFFIKGFSCKIGYALVNWSNFDFSKQTFFHCITIDLGYIIHFKRKIKRNSTKK
ncbi:MAG: FlgO family outer membrane protein [Spirochaetes bacterium]|nr:FlgO family outer membrane protein [Spirochaetota bacterium]